MSTTLIIIICILVADFITGLVHWMEDVYCMENYPIIGELVCLPNLLHHKDPNLMVRMSGIITTNWQSMSAAMFVCLLFWLFGMFHWSILLTLVLTGFGNQVHLWNHQAKSNYWVTWLKDSGLIQSQKQHSIHHIPPHKKCYCILINFNNSWMDRVGFWKGLEIFIEELFGIKPKR